jgi:hypothetical protein
MCAHPKGVFHQIRLIGMIYRWQAIGYADNPDQKAYEYNKKKPQSRRFHRERICPGDILVIISISVG